MFLLFVPFLHILAVNVIPTSPQKPSVPKYLAMKTVPNTFFYKFSFKISAIRSQAWPSPYGLLALLIASYSFLSESKRLNSL